MPNTSSLERQRAMIVACVLLLHALALWGLHSGLLQRAASAAQELVVQASVIIETPANQPQPPQSPLPTPRVQPLSLIHI